ncbi:MAG: RAMP superfamily CRISPR-associated protein [Halothece sp.]
MIYLEQLPSIPIEELSVTAIIETALSVGSGGSSGSLADQPIVRTAEGRLYLPASQLKGRVRHECEKLARGLGWQICESPNPETMCPQREGLSAVETAFQREDYQLVGYEGYHCLVCQLLGNPTLPSRIIFDDLHCETDLDFSEVIRPRVTINRRRKVAEDQKLYFLETSPMNAELRFTGSICFLPSCPEFGKHLVLASLKQIYALGGSKSTGLGWLRWQWEGIEMSELGWEQLRNHEQKQ